MGWSRCLASGTGRQDDHGNEGKFCYYLTVAPSTVRPLARDLRVLVGMLVGWPFPSGFGLGPSSLVVNTTTRHLAVTGSNPIWVTTSAKRTLGFRVQFPEVPGAW